MKEVLSQSQARLRNLCQYNCHIDVTLSAASQKKAAAIKFLSFIGIGLGHD